MLFLSVNDHFTFSSLVAFFSELLARSNKGGALGCNKLSKATRACTEATSHVFANEANVNALFLGRCDVGASVEANNASVFAAFKSSNILLHVSSRYKLKGSITLDSYAAATTSSMARLALPEIEAPPTRKNAAKHFSAAVEVKTRFDAVIPPAKRMSLSTLAAISRITSGSCSVSTPCAPCFFLFLCCCDWCCLADDARMNDTFVNVAAASSMACNAIESHMKLFTAPAPKVFARFMDTSYAAHRTDAFVTSPVRSFAAVFRKQSSNIVHAKPHVGANVIFVAEIVAFNNIKAFSCVHGSFALKRGDGTPGGSPGD